MLSNLRQLISAVRFNLYQGYPLDSLAGLLQKYQSNDWKIFGKRLEKTGISSSIPVAFLSGYQIDCVYWRKNTILHTFNNINSIGYLVKVLEGTYHQKSYQIKTPDVIHHSKSYQADNIYYIKPSGLYHEIEVLHDTYLLQIYPKKK
jgi:hypothetical protein